MTDISEINLRTYSRPGETRKYARLAGLLPAEAAILDRFRPDVAGARLLDIGVGGGRTTEALSALAREYVGVDYSAEMVERCRVRHPGRTFETADVRDLSAFGDDTFGVVVFSFNGIDSLNHADRLRAWAEMRRVLRPGGLLVVSSHNRNAPQTGAWSLSYVPRPAEWLAAPAGSAKKIAKYLLGIRNSLRNKRHELQEDEYAIVNEEAGCYGLMSYVITPERQVAQLRRAGFEVLEAVDLEGGVLAEPAHGTIDPWIYYVCRRP